MKILYVTDLHGDKDKYKKILEVAINKDIHVIVNGWPDSEIEKSHQQCHDNYNNNSSI